VRARVSIRPYDDQVSTPGLRLRVERLRGEMDVTISVERTLPERVGSLDARNITRLEIIDLTTDELVWLHARLGELLPGAAP
jgi:hypothetical protein